MGQYAAYVIAAYAATALILGGIVVQSVISARKARRELELLDRERKQ